jgi:type IV pilus assembly protein PilM
MLFLGIQIEGAVIRIARIRAEKKNPSIISLKTLPLSNMTSIDDPVQTTELTLSPNDQIITGLESHQVFLRTLDLPLIDKKKILSALPLQMEELLPFPLAECFVTPIICSDKVNHSSRIQIIAAKKEAISSHIKKYTENNIETEIISCHPVALMRFISFSFPKLQDVIVFNIGSQSSLCLLLISGKIETSYPFFLGTQKIFEALSKDCPDLPEHKIIEKAISLNFFEVSSDNLPYLFETLSMMRKEIDRILIFFQSKVPLQKIQNVILTGNVSLFPSLEPFFRSLLPKELELLPHPSVQDYQPETLSSYAIPIGLALDAAAGDINSIQLRQFDFLSPKYFQKQLRALLVYTGSCAVLAATLFSFGTLVNSKKEKKIEALCQHYFPQQNKAGGLEEKITNIQKKIGKNKKGSVFVPLVPSVSEVLAWISNHPGLEKTADSFMHMDVIDINHIKYQIIKYPKINSPNIIPVAKVELQFTCPSSRKAREFHDLLLAGDMIVDRLKEITWDVKDSVYTTSFFLRLKAENR